MRAAVSHWDTLQDAPSGSRRQTTSSIDIRWRPERGAPDRVVSGREQVDRLIVLIDRALNRQVNAIIHHAAFQAFEARWRGLAYLVSTSAEANDVRIKVLPVSWRELCRDLERSAEFDQSHLFDLVYNGEFGMAGGEPFGLLVGDFRVGHTISAQGTDDVAALRSLAAIAAAAFAPLLLEARPDLLGMEEFGELDRMPDIADAFQGVEFMRWQGLRGLEDTRFIGLLAPRVLMRSPLRPYDRARVDGFLFQEHVTAGGRELLWGSPAFAFARVVIRAFAESGWFAALRGAPQDEDAGGLVTDLPTIDFATDRAGLAVQAPVEIRLTSTQERAFTEHGLIPVGHAASTPYLTFNSNPSLHKPGRSQSRIADENSRIAAMLQYVLCASRFAHHLKLMMRDRIGSLDGPKTIETLIGAWLQRQCLGNDDATLELKAQFPLRDASVSVRELPGRPGVFGCLLRLQPHFQLDDVAASFQLVAEVSTTASS